MGSFRFWKLMMFFLVFGLDNEDRANGNCYKPILFLSIVYPEMKLIQCRAACFY